MQRDTAKTQKLGEESVLEPQGSHQKLPAVVTSKPANGSSTWD
jgi:hypothetical protein